MGKYFGRSDLVLITLFFWNNLMGMRNFTKTSELGERMAWWKSESVAFRLKM
jgi:hypothetical protein